jgi:hypothetical protein
MDGNNAFLRLSIFILGVVSTTIFAADSTQQSRPGQWSREKAWEWYNQQPWPCGFNYIPANAISYTEMWMDYAFDPKRIDGELKLAQEVGFNSLRVVFSYVVWEHEPEVFKSRFEEFLKICDKRSLKVMPIFFDDCVFGPIKDPVFGKQPDVVEGWYANGWTPSPGHSMVRDASTWPKLEKFVTDIIEAHKTDVRILCWDLYNEPTNGGLGDVSIPLVEKVFQWARRINPVQPLTAGCFNDNRKLNTVIFENSDILTFHNYRPGDHLFKQIRELKTLGRPIICTEWLNRGVNSIVITCLPVFYHENVGCLHWGLVNGKTQTDLNWGHQPGDPEPAVWQHDLYYSDYKPYAAEEINLFKFYLQAADSTKFSNAACCSWTEAVLPTSELMPQSWRYTTASPRGNWAALDYDDSQWNTGEGGFGTKGTLGLSCGTPWQTDQIWMRKEFQLETVQFSDLHFRLFHDEDIWIYINGELVIHRTGWSTEYVVLPGPHDKIGLFKTGRNVIAVCCRQTGGGQGVDVGIINLQKTFK